MKSVCIKTNNSNLKQYLLNELKNSNLQSICFSENEFKHYKNIIIHYQGKEDRVFLEQLSSILSFMVIDELEEDFIKRILVQNYFYFDANERNKIIEICFDILTEDFAVLFDKKWNLLYHDFYNFLSSHKSIVLNGFLNFRVKNYTNILEEIVSEAVNHFIVEKEYLEFISLLKLYISSQDTNANVVHLIYSSSESILLDENRNIIITTDHMLKSKYLSDISFSSNDYALNSLLTLLPKNIVIHLVDHTIDEFIHTLELVFENRVHLCTDCNLCNLYKESHVKREIKN